MKKTHFIFIASIVALSIGLLPWIHKQRVRAQGFTSTLMFQFVANQFGYDTSIVITNTSLPPFFASPTSGTCTLSFFGQNAPASVVIPGLQPGQQYTNVVSSLAPNFQGYVLASCNLPSVQGLSFIGNLGSLGTAVPAIPVANPNAPITLQ